MENSIEEKKWLEKAEKSIINQPIEGLLYDLDLMPEQCKSSHSNIIRLVVIKLREVMERLKIELKNTEDIKCQCDKDAIQMVKEKEWLAEELIELYERYTTTDMPKEEMKKMLFEEMQQALKEKCNV